jgi:hypothetical protein
MRRGAATESTDSDTASESGYSDDGFESGSPVPSPTKEEHPAREQVAPPQDAKLPSAAHSAGATGIDHSPGSGGADYEDDDDDDAFESSTTSVSSSEHEFALTHVAGRVGNAAKQPDVPQGTAEATVTREDSVTTGNLAALTAGRALESAMRESGGGTEQQHMEGTAEAPTPSNAGNEAAPAPIADTPAVVEVDRVDNPRDGLDESEDDALTLPTSTDDDRGSDTERESRRSEGYSSSPAPSPAPSPKCDAGNPPPAPSSTTESPKLIHVTSHRAAPPAPTPDVRELGQQTAGGDAMMTGGPRRSPRDRLRLPPLKRGQAAADMITKLVEQPMDLQQHHVPWRDGSGPGAAANDAAIKRADFPYDASRDKFLSRYWQRKDAAREVWRREAKLRRQRKHGSHGSNQQQPLRQSRTVEQPSLDRAGTAPIAPHSGSSPDLLLRVGSQTGAGAHRRGASWNVSAFPLNCRSVAEDEFLTLRTVFFPSAKFSSKMRVPNVDLHWLRPVMEGTMNSEASAALLAQNATRTLATMELDLLQHDASQYGVGNPFTKTLINSPRSTLVLLRNGINAYDLLRRPPKFFAQPSDTVTPAVLEARQQRVDAERLGLVDSLRAAYDGMCIQFSLETVASILRPRTVVDPARAAIVADRLEQDKRQLAFLNERTRRIAQADRERAEENAAAALHMELVLKERAESNQHMIRQKAAAAAAEMAAKKQVMERIVEEQARINAELHEASAEKREQLHQRVEELRRLQHDESVQKRLRKEAKAQASKEKVAERVRDRVESLEAMEATKRERALQHQLRVAQERAERAARNEDQEALRELNKLRAEELMLQLRERVESKLATAEERHEEFEKERDRDRRIRSVVLKKRHEQIAAAVEVAHEMELQRADIIRQRQQAAAAAVARRQAERMEETRFAGEASAFEIGHKRKVVDLTAQQQQFEKLHQLSKLQAREAEIGDFEQQKRDLLNATRQSRTELRLQNRVVKGEAAAVALKQERHTATMIYEISHPKTHFVPPTPLRNVGPRIDGLPKRSASTTPPPSPERTRQQQLKTQPRSQSSLH